MKIPRPEKDFVEFFKSVLPDDSRVKLRPMFGNISAFVNGNMFAGLYWADFFVRLSDDARKELLGNKGASVFEPMKGRPMKDYALIPRSRRHQPDTVRTWISKSLDWASRLPGKKKTR
jgi:TfoX/Sxy family transcriptional regulator of competence genes